MITTYYRAIENDSYKFIENLINALWGKLPSLKTKN